MTPGFDPQNIRSFGTWVQNWWMPWITFAISNGGGFVSAGRQDAAAGRPETIDAIQKMADLVNVDHVGPAPGTQQMPTAAATALLSQQVAMVVDGTWDLLTIGITKEQQGLDFGVGVLPYMKKLADYLGRDADRRVQELEERPRGAEASEVRHEPRERAAASEERAVAAEREAVVHGPEARLPVGRQSRPSARVQDGGGGFRGQLLPPASPVLRAHFLQDGRRDRTGAQQVWLGQKTAADVIKNEIMPKITPIFQGN